MEDNMILKRKGETSLATWEKRRIKRNQNVISITQGSTGSGKSYADIGIALEIDSEFDVEKQVVFSLSTLMKLINSEWFKKKKWKQVIFEESQISMSNRSWQSAMNKMLNYLLSTFRHQNVILYFNAPYKDFLDSQSMKLVHLCIDTKGIDRKNNYVKISPKILQYNSQLKKTYEHSIFKIQDGEVMQIGIIRIKKPPKEICILYEGMKKEFTDKLNAEIMKNAFEIENNVVDKPNKRPLTDKQEMVMKVLANNNYRESEKILKISISAIHKHKTLAEKKGYSLKDFKNELNEVKTEVNC